MIQTVVLLLALAFSSGLIIAREVFPPVLHDEDAVIPISKFGTKLYGLPDMEAGKALEGLNVSETNPEEIGPYLEGDMLIPTPLAKNGIIGDSYRWPDARIPYVIRLGFDDKGLELIKNAMRKYHENTCIRFVPRTPNDTNYISIEKTYSGCWSSLGMTGKGKQVVNLQQPACTTYQGTAIHELMHAVGFMHEQNRDDRDEYIRVNHVNIREGLEGNFAKMNNSNAMGVEYDYGSVMHYSMKAFSKNGRRTMTSLKKTDADIGQRLDFSEGDIKKINLMYNCAGKIPARGSPAEVSESSGGV